MRKVLQVVLVVPVVGLLALIAIGTAFPAANTVSPTPYSPLATVDDVYAALTVELHGATPDFETQVKPVLDLGLTYRDLQATAKAEGGLMGAVAAAVTAAPTQVAPAQPTRAPAVTSVATAVPNTARTVTMTQVLNVIRDEWNLQPRSVCTRGSTPCPPGPDFTRLSPMACDHTGDVAVPAKVICTYTDSALGPGTLPITIDANNFVLWSGCSPPGFRGYRTDCVQAAPTPPPVVAPAPANAPAASCGGIGYITVAITDSRPHPVAIWIDGQRVSDNIVNAWRVAAGSHTVIYRYADGSQVISSQYVGDCKSWRIRVS